MSTRWRAARASLSAPAVGALDQTLLAAGNFAFTVLLARWLDAGAYGAFALAYALVLLLGGIFNSLVIEPTCIWGFRRDRPGSEPYLVTAIWIHVLTTLPVSVLLAAVWVVGWAAGFHEMSAWPDVVAGAAVATPCLMLFWLLRRWAYVERAPARAVLATVCHVACLICGVVALRWTGTLTLASGMAALALAGVVAASVGILADPGTRRGLGRGGSDRATLWRALRAHWAYGRWAILASLVHWGAGNLYYYLTGLFVGLGDVGVLRAAAVCLQPIRTVQAGVTNVLFAEWGAARDRDPAGHAFHRRVVVMSAGFGAMALGYGVLVTALSETFLDVLFAGRYGAAAAYLPMLALATVFDSASDGPTLGLKVIERPRGVFLAFAAAAAVTVVVGVPVTAAYGTMGAAATSAGAALTMLAVSGALYRSQGRSAWTRAGSGRER